MLKGIRISGGITGGLLLLIILIPGIAGSFLNSYETEYPGWLTSALVSDRKELLRADSLRSLIFMLLGAGTIVGFVSWQTEKGILNPSDRTPHCFRSVGYREKIS